MSNKITDNWQKYLRENKKVEEKFSPEDFKDVYQTAQMAHVGQKRRDGSDYFSHPSEVRNIARKFYPKDNVIQMAALLHDALEDAPGSTVSTVEEMEDYIKGSIQDPASADEVIRVVRALTHEKGGDYQSYVVDLMGDVPTLRVKLADMVHNLSDNPTPKSKKKYRSALDAIAQKTGGKPPRGISDEHWNTLMSLSSEKVDEAVLSMDDMDALNDKVDEFGYTKEGLYELVIKVFQAMDSGDVSKILSQLRKTNEQATVADVVGHVAEKILDKDDGEYQRSIVKPVKMKEEEELDEKAVSKAQQRYFGMLKKCKEEGECADAEMKSKADKMTTKQVDDFAGTKHKGLPAQVKNEDLIQKIKEEVLNMLAEEPAKGKKYSKTVTNPKTGRKKKVSYGAKGYRIAPGTSKGDSYCARSYGIKKGLSKEKQNDPNTPNNLSRKKWKCRGKKSMKEEFTTEEIRMVIEDVIGKLEEAGKCQKGYKTHPTRKTKEMFGKQYRNCIKADEALRTRVRETIVRRLEEEGGCYSGKEICTAGLKFVVNSDSPGIKDVKCEDGKLKNWSARAAQIASKYCKDPNYGRGKKDESKEDFKPHKMYDPETGEEVEAKTHQDHIDLGKKGYVHEKPKVNEGDLQKWADEKWVHSDGTPCGDGREDGSVERCKPKAKWAKMSKGEKAADNAKKRAGTKKGKQNVSATKKGKVTKSYTKR